MTMNNHYVIIDNLYPELGAVNNQIYTDFAVAAQLADAWGCDYSVATISSVPGHYILELEVEEKSYIELAVHPDDAGHLLTYPLDGTEIADYLGAYRWKRGEGHLYVNPPDGAHYVTHITWSADPDEQADEEWRREIAMEAGMLHGCAGYNEVMGY